jgi:hypothetical protein
MTPPKIDDTQPDDELCPTGPGERCSARDVVHIPRENLRNLRRLAARQDALVAEIGPLRRQAALWRAGIKSGPAAELFLDRLPDDVNLSDAEAVRQACAEITAAVLDGHRQLAEATP